MRNPESGDCGVDKGLTQCSLIYYCLIKSNIYIDGRIKGQAGASYILHLMRIMSSMATEEGVTVAFLHDVIQDMEITINDLQKVKDSEEIINAINYLTCRDAEKHGQFKYQRLLVELA